MSEITVEQPVTTAECKQTEDEYMKYSTNPYGDVIIQWQPNKLLPRLDFNISHCVTVYGAPKNFDLAGGHKDLKYLIANTHEYGNIHGNLHASTNFPLIIEDKAQCASTVLLASHRGEWYAVLVKAKDIAFVISPTGYMNASDNTIASCAVRKVLEETELSINESEWQKLAEWEFDVKFAGYKFGGYTRCGWCIVDQLPKQWIVNLDVSKPTHEVLVDNDRTEKIVLISTKLLANLPSTLGISAHHFNLIVNAARLAGILPDDVPVAEKNTSYLRSFAYLATAEQRL